MAGVYTLQTSSPPVSILDEGITLVSAVSSINFVGTGVTGTNIGAAVTETIPGSTSDTPSGNEVVSFTGTSGTLAHTPIAGTLTLFRGGIFQVNPTDYSISGMAITLIQAASVGEVFIAVYAY